MRYDSICTSLALLLICKLQLCTEASHESEVIANWAEKFGRELWDLGQMITTAPEIKSRYVNFNAQVENKNHTDLMASVVAQVSRMMSRKMDAIKCILQQAEESARDFEPPEDRTNFTYVSAKFSPSTNKTDKEYDVMSLNEDTHFYNMKVNTVNSSVHVPTNVYDFGPEVTEVIMWSKELNDVFTKNYNSDPALYWQYFCSSTGIMRFFPAYRWENTETDLYDCRTSPWYVAATTCSKDIVILLDNTGSMYGMRNTIAQFTVSTLLDTLSNNDFVNVYTYNETVEELIPCFNDTLVHATPENLMKFREAVKLLKPEGNANLTNAFIKAFSILEEYRNMRGCDNDNECNQAIMLLTDGVAGNITEVFDEYNKFENGSYVPVRVFTYLLGHEVTKVREIQWMACLNRGYYVHVHSLEEVSDQVLKYIPVIARPLVLQAKKHPISWTHAMLNVSKDCENCSYTLLTQVAIPAFDLRNTTNDSINANLLGVAATDVPIADIEKLTLPYKLGVNAYAFVINNNGYVLMHPDLRPDFKGIIKDNFNSVDLIEIEQHYDDTEPRSLNEQIVQLREGLVNHSYGNVSNVSVKFHYDEMRRVTRQVMDFYYSPLHNTPFSIGVAIPHGYGAMWIKVGDELRKNLRLDVNIKKFFTGNWKIHPEWVYCKYHYLESHEFDNPEKELIHFLEKMSDLPNWKWSDWYEEDPILDDIVWGPVGTLEESYEYNCGRKTLKDNDYYCNRELVQRLVFDAKITEMFMEWTADSRHKKNERVLFEKYSPTLRFVATMSGLTRWQNVGVEDDNSTRPSFGEHHSKSIDETWYKSAVLQHEIDPDSFVVSVPFSDPTSRDENILVTASHAIFPRDGGQEAPGSVVGFQFEHSAMKSRFMEITRPSNTTCLHCIEACSSEQIDCYVIDNSAYVILSENDIDTGKFFGEIEGAIMKTLIDLEIFKKTTVYDLQAMCFVTKLVSNSCSALFTPFNYASMMIQWIISNIIWIITETQMYQLWDPTWTSATPTETPEVVITTTKKMSKSRKAQALKEEEELNKKKKEPVYKTFHYACEKEVDLYELQQQKFITSKGFGDDKLNTSSSPFYVKRIPHTNLLMIIVKPMNLKSEEKISATPKEITYDNDTAPPCHKLKLNSLVRRRLTDCYPEHILEQEIDACGKSNINAINNIIVSSFVIITVVYNVWCIKYI